MKRDQRSRGFWGKCRRVKSGILAVVLCGMMLFPALAERDVTGTWYSVKIDDGEMVAISDGFGVDSELTLNLDGTARWLLGGTEMEISWQADPAGQGIVLFLGDMPVPLRFNEKEELVLTVDEASKLIFARERKVTLQSSVPVRAEKAEDFLGNWVAAYLKLDSFLVVMEDSVPMVAGLVIEEDTVSCVCGWEEDVLDQYDAPFLFQEGKLILQPIAHEEMRIDEIEMTEGGMLFVRIHLLKSTDSETIELYFEKDEENEDHAD